MALFGGAYHINMKVVRAGVTGEFFASFSGVARRFHMNTSVWDPVLHEDLGTKIHVAMSSVMCVSNY